MGSGLSALEFVKITHFKGCWRNNSNKIQSDIRKLLLKVMTIRQLLPINPASHLVMSWQVVYQENGDL